MRKNIDEILMTNKQKYVVCLTVVLLLVAVGLFSYALTYDINYIGLNTNKISNCTIDISFKDSNPIRLLASYPMDYATAKEYDPYTFYIKSNDGKCNSLQYNISMSSICDSCTTSSCDLGDGKICNCTSGYQIDENLINYEIRNVNTEEIIIGQGINTLNEKFSLEQAETDTYEMRIWISETATNDDLYVDGNSSNLKNYCGKLNIEVTATNSNNYDTSGASIPVLASNMIPVYYDGTNWRKADKTNTNFNNPWYSYQEGIWANAVTVTEENGSRNDLVDASIGTIIPMERINTMFVWIPRFKATGDTNNYNGGTASAPGAFNVTFVDKNTSAHDAFTFGNNKLSGFWMGKFENSSNTTCSEINESAVGSGCNLTTIRPQIVPNKINWTGAQVSTFFYDILYMTEEGNQYGFDTNLDTNLNTHMIKNNEWGAVAYLTQSIYGRCTSTTNCTEIGINNSLEFLTGYGAPAGSSTSVATGPYDTNLGMDASTTGNIYGVYDMSGGSNEYVMGFYKSETLSEIIDYSGFSSSTSDSQYDLLPDLKYYNTYTTESDYTTFGLQHALTETNDWYNDMYGFVGNYYPWIYRGAGHQQGSAAGIFHYYSESNGGSSIMHGSRTIVTIE